MKSILRQINFHFKRTLIIAVMMFGVVFPIFYCTNYSDPEISKLLVVVMDIIIVSLISFIYFVKEYDFKKGFCKIPINAKLVDRDTIHHHVDDIQGDPVIKETLLTLEYQYKNKTYRKSIISKARVSSNVKINICKFFPKIIYITDNK